MSKVKACDICTRMKTNVVQWAGLIPTDSSVPMESVYIDHLSLELSNEIVENILDFTDHFTGYAQAIHTRYQTVRTAARVLFDNFIVHHGFPACIHRHQDQYFDSTYQGAVYNC